MLKITLVIAVLLQGVFLRAQDCECYAPTRQTAVRMMEKKEYAKALKLLRAADACPDKPSDNDLADKMQECRRAIRKEQERIEAGKRGVNLSARGTANCYVISKAGTYSFPTVKGNSTVSVGNVSRAEVLWESFGTSTAPSKGDIIQSVSYKAGSGSSAGTITFSTPSTLKNGNAVIAAKDASGNILWSWHIWVCKDYDPAATAHTYYNNAGVMMDRNLGATSATPGDVGALGLMYQWGRKDPFLGSSSISSTTRAESTISWPSPVSSSSSNGTIAYATSHPTTFITSNDSNDDWYYTGSSSTDKTRWQSSKTIYDPCPPGWRVPDGGSSDVWSKAVGSSSSFTRTFDSTNKGMNFSGKFGSAGTIWYPASGYLGTGDGSLTSVDGGGWWSCAPGGYYACCLALGSSGNVYLSGSSSRANGRSVRCLQE